jgi:mRNA-degrading endonuclease RelE of RelBE toxin-antitoxin system
MKKYLKFIFRKLQSGEQRKILQTIVDILAGNTNHLDIKKLSGYSQRYRCRIGNIRIVFETIDQKNSILKVEFRGNVY